MAPHLVVSTHVNGPIDTNHFARRANSEMTIGLCECLSSKEEMTQSDPPIDVFTLPFGYDPLLLRGEEANRCVRPDGPVKAEKEWGCLSQRPFDKVRIIMDIFDLPLCDCEVGE